MWILRIVTVAALLICAFGMTSLMLYGAFDRLALVYLFGGIGFVGFMGCIVIGTTEILKIFRSQHKKDTV